MRSCTQRWKLKPTVRPSVRALPASAAAKDMAAVAVEKLAGLILQSRLRKFSLVEVKVESDGISLLQGKMQAASVSGRDWESPAYLTARELQFCVGEVAIDYTKLLTQQQIVLHNVPVGYGNVVFNARDFGNFITHPLVTCAAAKAVKSGPRPAVYFSGTSVHHKRVYSAMMEPALDVHGQPCVRVLCKELTENPRGALSAISPNSRVVLQDSDYARPGPSDIPSQEVSEDLSNFFNHLLIDLQGVNLSFASMTIMTKDQNSTLTDPCVDLALTLKMVQFPPLNLKF
ncbi:hypothetical protein CEUSTIGMA_g10903.t1 [Chlamydomonas eustigma]|uniref:Uncharacterized protein n=1 Tax=Chlamydomonas eustigma TaxID=1157962 RepID=A0A250XK81_9CHLO|nr:hypothetical protein CEUSTIGMA_g10903.t1 [Chlamydomonas eustigma]|eukprot:GAX83478.1 hypothetical protein CEUSTIGMA_g10903.t1 [Chlamydomonas eustigma]